MMTIPLITFYPFSWVRFANILLSILAFMRDIGLQFTCNLFVWLGIRVMLAS